MRYRRFTGSTAAMLDPAGVVANGPALPALAGRPARCASDIHADRPAVVWGTFLNSAIRRDDTDRPNVGYCADCARVLTAVGWFQPDEGQTIPGEE
jgi:hypothetical protein